jgi:hypothetical protein
MKQNPIARVVVELAIKPYTSYDEETVRRVSHDALAFWRNVLEMAAETDVLLWVGDGDEVFNWRGVMEDTVNYNRSVGFNNMSRGAYPDNRHFRSHPPVDYMDNPPVLTYADLKRVVAALKEAGRQVLGRRLQVGTIVDAGPEFVESRFKFERHPELIEGGPNSRLPRTMAFINCCASMKADRYPYAEFPQGLPEGTSFGEFLGRQLRSMCRAVGFDYCWFSNGFGLTYYAWSYLGEVFDGRAWDVAAAPTIIERLVGFWRDFRTHCPDLRIELRGTNYAIGQDASAHGIDMRKAYAVGNVKLPPPNPPWGSVHLELEMAAFMSRMSWTPADRVLFRFYMNDSWFLSRPWWDYYNREPFDIYCPMSVSRVNADGSVLTPTDLSLMTVNTGLGALGHAEQTQSVEITPHFQRAFEYAPDAPGPVVWVYPFNECQDLAARGDEALRNVFFQDWFATRCIAGGFPLNTVIHTGAFGELAERHPEALAGTVLFAPVWAAAAGYVGRMLELVRAGGRAIFYGSLEGAPPELLEALNLRLADPIEGELAVTVKLREDRLQKAPSGRVMVHRSAISGGGVREVLADPGKRDTRVRVKVSREGVERVYCVSRAQRRWKGGMIGWMRGSLPFEAKPVSLEPIFDDPQRACDAGQWMRGLLEDFGICIRQSRRDASTPCIFSFVHRHEGAYVFSGHKPDATSSISFRFPYGVPVLEEREVLVRRGHGQYFLDKSFSFCCRVFVDQKAESVLRYKELRFGRGEHKHFRVDGLVDATVTIFPPPEFARRRLVKLQRVNVYSIPDPTAEEEMRKRGQSVPPPEQDLEYAVDQAAGAVVVRNVTGSLTALW